MRHRYGKQRQTVQADGGPATPGAAETRPRAVIEHADFAWQGAATHALERAGFEVRCCTGPAQLPKGRCPLVEGDGCPLVDQADVVINGLNLHDPRNRQLLIELHDRYPDLPVVVEATTQDIKRFSAELDGHHAVPTPIASGEKLAEEATAAMRERDARPTS